MNLYNYTHLKSSFTAFKFAVQPKFIIKSLKIFCEFGFMLMIFCHYEN